MTDSVFVLTAAVTVGIATERLTLRAAPSLRPVGFRWLLAGVWLGVVAVGAPPAAYALTWWCGLLTSLDLGSRRLPNVLTVLGAVAVTVYAAVTGSLVPTLFGALALFACYLVVHLAAPGAFGAGDVKLAFAVGGVAAMFGWHTWVSAALWAPFLTAGVGVVVAAVRGRGASVPHGPSMCLATLMAVTAAPA